jgi:Fe-S-cluster containining protein
MVTLYSSIDEPLGTLDLVPDPGHEGWQIMRGPCVFRRQDSPLSAGGCRIYDHRPAGCRIFTCRLLLESRRDHFQSAP